MNLNGSKYIKYNRPYKVKHYKEMMWCYKANFKTNPLNLRLIKTNCVLTLSSILIAKRNTKWIVIYALSRDIISINSGILRSIKSSVKKEAN